jgi:hypothetical protein
MVNRGSVEKENQQGWSDGVAGTILAFSIFLLVIVINDVKK